MLPEPPAVPSGVIDVRNEWNGMGVWAGRLASSPGMIRDDFCEAEIPE